MKKLYTISLIAMLSVSLTGCGASNDLLNNPKISSANIQTETTNTVKNVELRACLIDLAVLPGIPPGYSNDKNIVEFLYENEYGNYEALIQKVNLYQMTGNNKKLIYNNSQIRPGKDSNLYAEANNKNQYYLIGNYQAKGNTITDLNISNNYILDFNFGLKNIESSTHFEHSSLAANVIVPQNAIPVIKNDTDFLEPSNSVI